MLPARELTAKEPKFAFELKKSGGGTITENSVHRSLNWLVANQNEDGSWGDWQDDRSQKVQLTCLVLDAILTHDEDYQSEQYGNALRKGITRVLAWVDGVGAEAGSGLGRHEAGKDQTGAIQYRNNDLLAVSRIAVVLAKAKNATKDPAAAKSLDLIMTRLYNEMNPSGGFGWKKNEQTGQYMDKLNMPVDLSCYKAICVGTRTGSSKVSGKDYTGATIDYQEAYRRACDRITNYHTCAKGGFSLLPQDASRSRSADLDTTAKSIFILYMMGRYGRTEADKACEWLLNFSVDPTRDLRMRMDWSNLPSQMSMRSWYLMSYAFYQMSTGEGSNWRRWNRQMTTSLIKELSREGYWECPADKYKQWQTVKVRLSNGRIQETRRPKAFQESKNGVFSEHNAKIWATAHGALMLEVYYAYHAFVFKPKF